MPSFLRGFAVSLCPVLLVAACGSPRQHTTRVLDQRLQTQLASAVAARRATIQKLPDGARVTLLENSLFPNNVPAMTGGYPDVRSSVIESLLDPTLMRVQVADTTTLPQDQRDARVNNVIQYFDAYGLASVLRPPQPPQAPPPQPALPSPAGLTITISVFCPNWHAGPGYGNGQSNPSCG